MKKIVLMILSIFALSYFGFAQTEGIRFEKPEWNKLVRKAIKEKKLIFVDCYTSWCGPCKDLANRVFPQKVVGDFYNRHFVSAKVDMDKDAMAKVLEEKFTPVAYPTLLFIDPQSGEIAHMVVGGGEAERIIRMGKQAVDKEHNLLGLTQKYQAGEREAGFMKDYLAALASSDQTSKQETVTADYLSSLPDEQLVTKENWEVFKGNIKDPLAPAFQRMMNMREKLYRVEDKSRVDNTLKRIIHNGVSGITEPSVYDVLNGKKVDEERNRALIDYFQSVDFEATSAALAKLITAEFSRKGDYKAMWISILNAYAYNVFRGVEDYGYIWNNIPALVKGTDDPEILQAAADLMDRLNQEKKPAYYRVCLMNRKAQTLDKKGDKAGAEEAKALAKKYQDEEDRKSE